MERELAARGLTTQDLALIAEDLPQTVDRIIEGNQQITIEIAVKLSKAFSTSVECWINLENNYRHYLAKKSIDQLQ